MISASDSKLSITFSGEDGTTTRSVDVPAIFPYDSLGAADTAAISGHINAFANAYTAAMDNSAAVSVKLQTQSGDLIDA